MTGRRKGTPCACSDDCGCSSSKGKCIRAINNISPDPNGDFNINAGTGIIISGDENGIIIANGMPDPASLVAGDNIEINAIGDDLEIALTQNPVINGDLTVNGDIIQNGAAYETHAEHIYTADDYIIMRDGAISALSAGDYSGFQVKLYDGVNDGRLVIDNSGTARVGDVGDEQPLMTRDESADLTSGNLLEWDGVNQKAIDAGVDAASLQSKITVLNTTASSVSLTNNANVLVTSLTATKTGKAIINARLEFSSATSGTRVAGYSINSGGTIWLANPLCDPTPPNTTVVTITYIVSVNNGDIVNIKALQTSGSTLTVNANFSLMIV